MKKIFILYLIIYLFVNFISVFAGQGDVVFKFQTDGSIFTCPAIGNDGTIYFANLEGNLYALNPDGSLKWRYYTGLVEELFSSPVIDKTGTIYFADSYNHLYAVNPDGTLKWKCYIEHGTSVSVPAIGNDGTIYIGSPGPGLYAINQDGSIKWMFDTESALGVVHSSSAIDRNGTIYIGAEDSYFYAINSDGSFKWSYKTQGFIDSSPAIDINNETVYFGSDDGNLYALDKSGSLKWKVDIGSPIKSSPVIDNIGTIYFGSDDGYLSAVTSSGKLKWRYKTLGEMTTASPFVTSEGTIYIAPYDGYLYAVDTEGKLKWKYYTRHSVNAISATIDKNGIIYLGSDDGYLHAVDSGTYSQLDYSSWPKFHGDIQNTGNPQTVEVYPQIVEIKNVEFEDGGTSQLTIRNKGLESITINSITTDNDTFLLNPTSAIISADDSLIVIISYSPINYQDQTAKLTINTSETYYYVHVLGTVSKPEIAMSDDKIHIGYIHVNQKDTTSFLIFNEGTEDLIVSKIDTDNDALSVNPNYLEITPGDSDSVSIIFSPIEIGTVKSNIVIQSNDPVQNTVYLPVESTVFLQDSIQNQLYYTVTIDNPATGMAHIDGLFINEGLSQPESLVFYIKNFNVFNIEFTNENNELLIYDNWNENFQNYFKVYHKNSSEIRIKYDIKMGYKFEESPETGYYGNIDEKIGRADHIMFLLFPLDLPGTIADATYNLPNNWIALSNINGFIDYHHYLIDPEKDYDKPVHFSDFKIFEREIKGTNVVMAFSKSDGYERSIAPDFGFSIFEYFSNVLGPYPEERVLGDWSVYSHPPREHVRIYNFYDLGILYFYPHLVGIVFFSKIGGDIWMVEGYDIHKSLLESGNSTYRFFYEILLTLKWNYENIIYGHSDEVSLYNVGSIYVSNTPLYFQIAQGKTSLVMFLLDRKIREITSNSKTINDFLKYVYETYLGTGLNYDTYEMKNVLNTFTGFDFTDFFNRYIFGKDKLPLDDYFDDNDDDGLLNFTEDDLGTNMNTSDTDGDGTSDALESFYYFTDPLNVNSYPNLNNNQKLKKGENATPSMHTQQFTADTEIFVDGYGEDWENIPNITVDPKMDFGGFEYDNADIRSIKVLIKNDNLYMYTDFHAGHSITIAYDILFDTKSNTGPTKFDYLLRYDIFGNAFLYDVSYKYPEDIIDAGPGWFNLQIPIGIMEVKGICKDILEVSLPVDLIEFSSKDILVEVRTVVCTQFGTINSEPMLEQRILPYMVGDTATFTIQKENESPLIYINFPSTDTVITESDSIEFLVTARDVDSDTLYYSWYYDDTIIKSDTTTDSTAAVIRFPFGSKGTHSVKVSVSDGELSAYITWNITVREIISQPEKPIAIILPEDSSSITVNFIDNSSLSFAFTGGNVADKSLTFTQYLSISDSFPDIPDFDNGLYYYNISFDVDNFDAELTFGYTDSLLNEKGITEDSLAVCVYDSTDWRGFIWHSLPVEIDKDSNKIKVTTNHFSLWAIVNKNEEILTGLTDEEALSPKEFTLYQNYPNPFNPETTIKYQLPKTSKVTLSIYNILGQKIKTLVDEEKPSGYYSMKWDGTNDFGVKVSSGIYIYRMETNKGFVKTRKLVFLK